MQRREFIRVYGGAAVGWPLVARAQQAVPMIGFLNGGSAWEYADVVAAFRQGLRDAGRVEDQNLRIEYRWAEGHYERLPTLAAELVYRRVTAIAASAPAAVAAKSATTSIPIVFVTAADPVEIGLVRSLNRPGGNLTRPDSAQRPVSTKETTNTSRTAPSHEKVCLASQPGEQKC